MTSFNSPYDMDYQVMLDPLIDWDDMLGEASPPVKKPCRTAASFMDSLANHNPGVWKQPALLHTLDPLLGSPVCPLPPRQQQAPDLAWWQAPDQQAVSFLPPMAEAAGAAVPPAAPSDWLFNAPIDTNGGAALAFSGPTPSTAPPGSADPGHVSTNGGAYGATSPPSLLSNGALPVPPPGTPTTATAAAGSVSCYSVGSSVSGTPAVDDSAPGGDTFSCQKSSSGGSSDSHERGDGSCDAGCRCADCEVVAQVQLEWQGPSPGGPAEFAKSFAPRPPALAPPAARGSGALYPDAMAADGGAWEGAAGRHEGGSSVTSFAPPPGYGAGAPPAPPPEGDSWHRTGSRGSAASPRGGGAAECEELDGDHLPVLPAVPTTQTAIERGDSLARRLAQVVGLPFDPNPSPAEEAAPAADAEADRGRKRRGGRRRRGPGGRDEHGGGAAAPPADVKPFPGGIGRVAAMGGALQSGPLAVAPPPGGPVSHHLYGAGVGPGWRPGSMMGAYLDQAPVTMGPPPDVAWTATCPLETAAQSPGSNPTGMGQTLLAGSAGAAAPQYNLVPRAVPPEAPVKKQLLAFAEAIATDDQHRARFLMGLLREVADPRGDPLQRLVFYFLDALWARVQGTGALRQTAALSGVEVREVNECMAEVNRSLPFMEFMGKIINSTFLDAIGGEKVIHILDLATWYQSHWPALMRVLAHKGGEMPRIRITKLLAPKALGPTKYYQTDAQVRSQLAQEAAATGVSFEYRSIETQLEHLTAAHLGMAPGELLVVNASMRFNTLSDGSVVKSSPRDAALRAIRALEPRLVLLGEKHVDHNDPFFLRRFAHCVDFYSSVFESIDAGMPRESGGRAVFERNIVAREIVNVIACEGLQRVTRSEPVEKWVRRMRDAGFACIPPRPSLKAEVAKLLERFPRHFGVLDMHGALMLSWKGRPMMGTSIWRPAC